MDKEKILLDLPVDKSNDAIGFDTYVDTIVNAIESEAKNIAVVSNYGSGKSTILKMVNDKLGNKPYKFIPINLWKIKSNHSKNTDDTIEIHKFLLKNIIDNLTSKSTKDYFLKKIDGKYSLFSLSMKNKKDIYGLYLIFAVFLFNIILKIDILGFSVPRICNFILDFVVAINFIYILASSNIYLSFNSKKTERIINESDTKECFFEVIEELKTQYEKIIICIEDIDRYNDSEFVITILEQIYKLYVTDNNVKFIISLKPSYNLLKDDKNLQKNNNDTSNLFYEYKELYEKMFDLIVNLQTVSYQNYSSVLLELVQNKRELLSEMNIEIPIDIENIGDWNCLYKGNNISIRDIKHRFNYFIILYENLYRHKENLEDKDLIKISIKTCLFVSYLEDEFSSDFYELINDSNRFDKIVSEYLLSSSFSELDEKKPFDLEIINSLKNGLIDENYSMYFYKYPKSKQILNIFDKTIQHAIYIDSTKEISDLNEYCEKASKNIINKSIKEKLDNNVIPEIIFDNNLLYNEANNISHEKVFNYLEEKYIFSSENGIKQVSKMLSKNNKINDYKFQKDYLELLYNDLNANYDEEKIVEYRKTLLKSNIDKKDLLIFYDSEMPFIDISELQYFANVYDVFNSINVDRINQNIYEMIENVINKYDIKFNVLISFFDKISMIDSNVFKEIFFKFDYSQYKKSDCLKILRKKYSALESDNIDDNLNLIKKLGVMTIEFESKLIDNYEKINDSQKEMYENKYVEIIKIVQNISSKTKNIIPKFKKIHCYNDIIEDQLYKYGLYKEYCYSKFNRLNKMIYEEDKQDELKELYKYYFINSSKLSNEYVIDDKMLKYLKDNIDYKKLSIKKILLLKNTIQTMDDFNIIINNEYKSTSDSVLEDDINEYLSSIKKIAKDDLHDFVELLIRKVKNKEIIINEKSYINIKLITNKPRKIQQLKKYIEKN